MIVAPDPESLLVSTITLAPSPMACSAWLIWFWASPSAFTIVKSVPSASPAAVKDSAKNRRSSFSQRSDVAVSGRSTQMLPPSSTIGASVVSVAPSVVSVISSSVGRGVAAVVGGSGLVVAPAGRSDQSESEDDGEEPSESVKHVFPSQEKEQARRPTAEATASGTSAWPVSWIFHTRRV